MARLSIPNWNAIHSALDAEPSAFGLPERRARSIVISSFNIRSLSSGKVIPASGKGGRTDGSWRLLARFASQCDLLAIQEVGDNLDGLNQLISRLDRPDKYGVIVSDITGWIPGKDTTVERLAFLFRWDRVERTALASDITYDRRAILDTIYGNREDFTDDYEAYDERMALYEERVKAFHQGKRKTKPKNKPPLVLSNFVSFIRTPHCVSFRVPGQFGAKGYEFLAVNAHLLYGKKSLQKMERRREFLKLVDWLIYRTRHYKKMYYPDFVLFGDLNLAFDDDADREATTARIKALNAEMGRGYWTNFPFLSQHPKPELFGGTAGKLYDTTARMTQTYDHIAFFSRRRGEDALPHFERNAQVDVADPDGYNYGVFNFMDLFAKGIFNKKSFAVLSKQQRTDLVNKIQYDVSDHMPIWVRLPVPTS